MKLQFNADLDYQWDAISAITDIFKGQDTLKTNFSVTQAVKGPQSDIFSSQSDLGVGNKLDLLDDELFENIRNVQLKQGLKQTKEGDWLDQVRSKVSRNFTVEMETGTGKTYVYLRSIFTK